MKKLLHLNIELLRKNAKKNNSCGKRARRKLEILRQHNFQCVDCKSKESLTIAHINKINKGYGRSHVHYKPHECKVLCVECHVKEHENE